jgi:hypothetical protein
MTGKAGAGDEGAAAWGLAAPATDLKGVFSNKTHRLKGLTALYTCLPC